MTGENYYFSSVDSMVKQDFVINGRLIGFMDDSLFFVHCNISSEPYTGYQFHNRFDIKISDTGGYDIGSYIGYNVSLQCNHTQITFVRNLDVNYSQHNFSCFIGRSSWVGGRFNRYALMFLDELRISKGIARSDRYIKEAYDAYLNGTTLPVDIFNVGVWHMDNLSDETHTQDLISMGNPVFNISSPLGHCVYFDGKTPGACFNITNDVYRFYTEDVTLEAVVRFCGNRTQYDTVIGFGDDRDNYPLIRMHHIRSGFNSSARNSIACEQNYNTTSDWVWSNTFINTGWHYVVARFDKTSNETSIFVDGIKQNKTERCMMVDIGDIGFS